MQIKWLVIRPVKVSEYEVDVTCNYLNYLNSSKVTENVRKLPKVSKSVQMCPNMSKIVQKLLKVFESLMFLFCPREIYEVPCGQLDTFF